MVANSFSVSSTGVAGFLACALLVLGLISVPVLEERFCSQVRR